MEKRKNIILAAMNVVWFAAMVTVNALANILPINGKNTGEISDQYPNLFVPAGITFSIWGLIYLLLLIFVINQLYLAVKEKTMGLLSIKSSLVFGLTCILNALWILAWHYEIVALSLLIMVALLLSLIYLFRQIEASLPLNKSGIIAVSVPISVYLGWISVATIANVTSLLVSVNWSGFGIAPAIWTILVILVGGALAVIMLLKKQNIAYAAVVLWAYTGIIIKRMAEDPVRNDILYVVYGVMAVIIVLMINTIMGLARKRQ